MPPAARVGDVTGHPGVVTGPGVPTVLIGGLPAAVVGDTHTCAMPAPAGPHPAGPFQKGSQTVLIGGKPAVRMGDTAPCQAPILSGAVNVLIGG
ncbi:MAG TPA: PAAR domain-containing protein [Actinomycetota bacterium]|nr:PAAR domain-containing protein [Actinomycetota bacterium]